MIEQIIRKIRQLEWQEHRLCGRLPFTDRDAKRDELARIRFDLGEYYSRLAHEIRAVRLRRLSELPGLIQIADPVGKLDLRLEQRRLKQELVVLDVDAEIKNLLR
jgi:hypothetical protein